MRPLRHVCPVCARVVLGVMVIVLSQCQGFLSHRAESMSILKIFPHYLKDREICLKESSEFGIVKRTEALSLKAEFSDFATFSFVRQHLKFIEQDFICGCANSLPSCLKGRDTTFCSILWNTPPALPSWNAVFFHWGVHLFLQWEHSSAVWRLHWWWQRIKGGKW